MQGGWYLWHKSIRLQWLVSFTKPVYCFCKGTYQSVALHLTTSMELFSMDWQVSECHHWVHLACIDRGIDFYREHLAQLLLQNFYTVMSKRRVLNTLTVWVYVHANATKGIEMYDLIEAEGRGSQLRSQQLNFGKIVRSQFSAHLAWKQCLWSSLTNEMPKPPCTFRIILPNKLSTDCFQWITHVVY